MSNFNNASLIVTPNAFKAGKLYSLKGADLDVVRATNATRVNASGSIVVEGNNIPRLDYTNASCPSILVEPQRTNLVFPSAIATTQTRSVTAVAHTLSFYGTGSVTLSGVATGTLNGTGANNRVTLTFTPTAGNLTLTVSGSVTDWQLEAGSTATSYIPTVASAMTRNADVISKTGISSLIGQTEGTMYFEVDIQNSELGSIASIDDGSANNFITLTKLANRSVRVNIRRGGGAFPAIIISPILSVGKHKIGLGYKNGDYALYIDGASAGVSSNSTDYPIGTLLRFNLSDAAYGFFNDYYNSALLFPTRLSNAELAQLTTL